MTVERDEKTLQTLPRDLATAHQHLLNAEQLIKTLREELLAKEHEVARLRHQLDLMCKRLFGKKSERVSPEQLRLAFEQLSNEAAAANEPVEMDSGESPIASGKKRAPSGRRPLPSSLPRETLVVDLAEKEKTCPGCGGLKEKIGQETSEKLEYVPASLFVRQTVTLKYACPRCHEGVTTAKAPAQAVEKGLAGEGLLSYVITSKYVDHLPLYRLERIFERQGVSISRATMCGWVAEAADALSPIVDFIRGRIVGGDYIQTDDTPVTVLGEKGGSFKGRLWTYLDPLGREVVFEATATHQRDGPEKFLAPFRGYLQADAYKGYDALYRSGRIVEVGCWAHARRRFVEALETDVDAATVVALVQRLYNVEKEAEGLTPEERVKIRQRESAPILSELDRIRAALAPAVLPKSPLGEALRYLENQRVALGRFLDDGRLKLDNNGAENQLRVVAVGRKNWLFAGSLEGARHAAILYSLAQSCKLAGVDPFGYVRDVLLKVATHPASRIEELAPKAWAQLHAASRAA